MAISRKFNPADLIAARSKQTITKSFGSTDSNFPLFKTPVNENWLVYIPTLNLVDNGDGTFTNELLHSASHKFSTGKQYGDIPCITGFPMDSIVAEALGYTDENGAHTCPACDALSECWDLVNAKVASVAKQIMVDPGNDRDEKLKPHRTKFMQEMAIQRPVEYVTFPIVMVPAKNNKPTEDAMDKMQGYFVTMAKQRYEEKVCAGLDALFDNPGHIAGRWMTWKFTYDTKGAQPNARDAAKNAQFMIITDSAAITALKPYVEKAEEIGAKFTNTVALEVLTALKPQTYEEILASTNRVMKETRNTLAAMEAGNSVAVLPNSTEQALAAFGAEVETTGTNDGVSLEKNGDLGVTQVTHRFG